jgi:hypothetical protein
MKGKAAAALSVFVLATLLLSSCIYDGPIVRGSGSLVTKTMDLSSFSGVDASYAFQVDITQGEAFSVSVTADDNLWDRLQVRVNGQTLELGLQPGAYNNTHLSAKVSMPALSKLSLSGASRATMTGFKSASDMSMDLSGASSLNGDVQAKNMDLGLSGASRAVLTGAGDGVRLDASGASNADLGKFPVNTATLTLSGASRANLNVKTSLDYDLSGASHLSYTGSPSVGKSQTSGASSVDH